MKKILAGMVLSFLLLQTGLSSQAFANHGGGACGQCQMKQCELTEKFFAKAHGLWMNQETFELTREQVVAIKSLKMETKKQMIRDNADMEVLAIDIKAGLWGDAVDVNNVNSLVEQTFEIKKRMVKNLVAAEAKLRDLLKPEQWAALSKWMRQQSDGGAGQKAYCPHQGKKK